MHHLHSQTCPAILHRSPGGSSYWAGTRATCRCRDTNEKSSPQHQLFMDSVYGILDTNTLISDGASVFKSCLGRDVQPPLHPKTSPLSSSFITAQVPGNEEPPPLSRVATAPWDWDCQMSPGALRHGQRVEQRTLLPERVRQRSSELQGTTRRPVPGRSRRSSVGRRSASHSPPTCTRSYRPSWCGRMNALPRSNVRSHARALYLHHNVSVWPPSYATVVRRRAPPRTQQPAPIATGV